MAGWIAGAAATAPHDAQVPSGRETTSLGLHGDCDLFGGRATGPTCWVDNSIRAAVVSKTLRGIDPPDSKGWPMERELTLDETVTLLKDRNAKAREAITALTAEVAELREENKKLLDQLVAAGFRNDELAQAPSSTPRPARASGSC
jgi:hypothetical protein